jgi:hypothetical protein
MTETILAKNMKKWFWSFFLGQALLFTVAAIWFSATMASAVNVHDQKIQVLYDRIDTKADISTVMRIKSDNDRVQEIILEDLKYIRNRIDEHMERDKK